MNYMKIAVILTCFNRKKQTISCLEQLYSSVEKYNNTNKEEIVLSVFLTDDGCTDGTSDAIRDKFADKDITILKGNGNLFWAGGMRLAWRAALANEKEWDFYLLLNDDTDLLDCTWDELMGAHQYCLATYGNSGIYSGITSAKRDHGKMTYGGDVWVNKLLAKSQRLKPTGTPQRCDMTNANILLVSNDVVKKIGIFSEAYTHGIADYDYSIRANKNGFPVLVTANFCGRCENDHKPQNDVEKAIKAMSLKERKAYFRHPLHSNSDYLAFIKANAPLRYPIVWFGRFLNTYFPKMYYSLSKNR